VRQKSIQVSAALVAVLVARPAVAGEYGVVHGVNADAVPWGTFCAGVLSVPVERGGGRCAVSHPASPYHGRFQDFTGLGKTPPPNCDIAAKEYQRWTTPAHGSSDPWAQCRMAWSRALYAREQQPERFSEPFTDWREKHFGRWLARDE